jgi:tetratricopeptide (TPR) repeat protein
MDGRANAPQGALARAREAAAHAEDPAACAALWEDALREHPGSLEALVQLSVFYEVTDDKPRLARVLREQAAQTADRSARAALLARVGALSHASGALPEALEAWTGVLALLPEHHEALEYVCTHAPESVASLPLERFQNALDARPGSVGLFAAVVQALTALGDFEELDRAYRKMLLASRGHGELEYTLLYNLGVLRRDRLGDPDGALEALALAARRRPEERTVTRSLATLSGARGRREEAHGWWHRALVQEPRDEAAWLSLYELFQGAHDPERAWRVAHAATAVLGPALREDLRRFSEAGRPKRFPTFSATLTDAHWEKLCHPDQGAGLGAVFRAVLPVLERVRCQPIERFGFAREEVHTASTSSASMVKAWGQAARALGLAAPLVVVRPKDPEGLRPLASLPPAAVAGRKVLAGLTPAEVLFVAGRGLALHRPEHAVRVLYPSVPELTTLLLACVRLARPDHDVAPEVLQTARQFGPLVAEDLGAVEALVAAVDRLGAEGGALDLDRWSRAVDATAARSGALLGGDLQAAARMLEADPLGDGHPSPQELLLQAALFFVSPEGFALRDALHVAPQ